MQTKSSHSGTIDHAVTVESTGQFRIVFEAAYNYGLSKWFDLVNDQEAKNSITRNVTSYLPDHAQGALFNQVFSPGDLIAHIISAKKYLPNEKRAISLIEINPLRVVLECSYNPMIGTDINRNIKLTTHYVIYPTGAIFITNTMHSLVDQEIAEWRNSIIGLGDPSYMTTSDAGEMSAVIGNELKDATKNWRIAQWAGFQLNQSEYNSWEILSNSSNTLKIGKRLHGNTPLRDGPFWITSRDDKFGWLRSTDLQSPYEWHKERAKYLLMYWDPTTPPPYSTWTDASMMLVPHSDNPYQGSQSTHGWKGFKRFYYQVEKVSLRKGTSIVQHYMMQLGTKGSTVMPDLSTQSVAATYAGDYLSDHKLELKKGAITGNGFDIREGCYTLRAVRNELAFVIDGHKARKIKPIFKVHEYSYGRTPKIRVNGDVKKAGNDYIWQQLDSTTLIVQFLFDINSEETIELT